MVEKPHTERERGKERKIRYKNNKNEERIIAFLNLHTDHIIAKDC